jgi:RNA polymerase sigma-19 factor, ECF subfamily
MNMRAAGKPKTRSGGWIEALEQLREGLYRYLAQRLHNAQSAEELAQEVYLRLLRVENPGRVKCPQAYMYRVAVNALQEFRAREDSSPVAFDSALVERLSERAGDESPSHDEWLDTQANERALEGLIAQLPPMQRKVLLMATSQGLPHAQIGEVLGISVRTVRNHLYRALYFCRRQMSLKDGKESPP